MPWKNASFDIWHMLGSCNFYYWPSRMVCCLTQDNMVSWQNFLQVIRNEQEIILMKKLLMEVTLMAGVHWSLEFQNVCTNNENRKVKSWIAIKIKYFIPLFIRIEGERNLLLIQILTYLLRKDEVNIVNKIIICIIIDT